VGVRLSLGASGSVKHCHCRRRSTSRPCRPPPPMRPCGLLPQPTCVGAGRHVHVAFVLALLST
jgi:hypothetical protein